MTIINPRPNLFDFLFTCVTFMMCHSDLTL